MGRPAGLAAGKSEQDRFYAWWEREGAPRVTTLASCSIPPRDLQEVVDGIRERMRERYAALPWGQLNDLSAPVTRTQCVAYWRRRESRQASLDAPREDEDGEFSREPGTDPKAVGPEAQVIQNDCYGRLEAAVLEGLENGELRPRAVVVWQMVQLGQLRNREVRSAVGGLTPAGVCALCKEVGRFLWRRFSPERLAADRFSEHFVRQRPSLMDALEAMLIPAGSGRPVKASNGGAAAVWVAQRLAVHVSRRPFVHGGAETRLKLAAEGLARFCLDASWADDPGLPAAAPPRLLEAASWHQRQADHLAGRATEERVNLSLSAAIEARAKIVERLLPRETNGGADDGGTKG